MDQTQPIGAFIRRHKLLTPRQRVVVGVSGGPDSLCLMDGLRRLGYRPLVAHYDHRLRPESRSEAERVARLAGQAGLPVEVGSSESILPAGHSEETARIERYRFLSAVARRYRIRTLAVGHTADDQVETVLMHLLRGAGPAGLRGMLPATRLGDWVGAVAAPGLTLVRPLLDLRRSETLAHCEYHGLQPVFDPSNRELRYFRNWLRHELIPQLRQHHPAVETNLLRLGKLMAAEHELLDAMLESNWPIWFVPEPGGALRLQPDRLLEAPLALQRAALRRSIQVLRPDLRDIGFEAIERGLAGLRDRRRTSLVGRLELLPVDGAVLLRPAAARLRFPGRPQLRSLAARTLRVPATVSLANRWAIELRAGRRSRGRPARRGQVRFDRDRLPGPLVIRPPRPADRLEPIGMRGSVKLSDLFINRKVPQAARARWPVLTSGDTLLWVPGLHRSRVARPSRTTRRLLELRLRPPAG
jgi:tRNA(Ile)-lysidine synthase